jgi:transcriptional regulator with XRE-family HTH domain
MRVGESNEREREVAKSISEEVAAAMRLARELSGLTPEQFARELNRLVPDGDPDTRVSALYVEMMEAGEFAVLAEYLVAAARIAEQPVSSILGELELYTLTIPALERRVSALEERAGL